MSSLKSSESSLISFKPTTQNPKSSKKKKTTLFRTVLSLLPMPAPHALTAKSLQSSLLHAIPHHSVLLMLSAVPFHYVIFALKLPESPNSTATF